MTSANESRPAGNGTAIKNTGGRSDNHPTAPEALSATWIDGFTHGRAEGILRGLELADDEAAARHRALMDHLEPILRAPEVDRAEAAARRARIDERFDQRFGGERG